MKRQRHDGRTKFRGNGDHDKDRNRCLHCQRQDQRRGEFAQRWDSQIIFITAPPGDILGVSKLTMSMWFKRESFAGVSLSPFRKHSPAAENSEISIQSMVRWNRLSLFTQVQSGTAAGDDNGEA